MRMIAGLLGGFILAVLCAVLMTIAVAASPEKAIILVAASFSLFWGAGFAIALFAKSARKAWRRLLLASSVISFLLSLADIAYTVGLMTQIDSAGVHAAGLEFRGGSIASMLGLIGFSLGVIFLTAGLLTGRDKQVIHVQTPSDVTMTSDEKQRLEPQLKE